MSEIAYPGSCFCGNVRFVCEAELKNVCFCHCESCRKAIGAPMVAWGTIETKNFKIVAGEVKYTNSSKGVTRGFCSHCGTSLTYAHELRDTEIDITLVSIESPPKPERHIWVRDKWLGLDINDGLPMHKGWASDDN